MPYAEFIQKRKVVFRQALSDRGPWGRYRVHLPDSSMFLDRYVGQSTVLGPYIVQVRDGEMPDDPLPQPPGQAVDTTDEHLSQELSALNSDVRSDTPPSWVSAVVDANTVAGEQAVPGAEGREATTTQVNLAPVPQDLGESARPLTNDLIEDDLDRDTLPQARAVVDPAAPPREVAQETPSHNQTLFGIAALTRVFEDADLDELLPEASNEAEFQRETTATGITPVLASSEDDDDISPFKEADDQEGEAEVDAPQPVQNQRTTLMGLAPVVMYESMMEAARGKADDEASDVSLIGGDNSEDEDGDVSLIGGDNSGEIPSLAAADDDGDFASSKRRDSVVRLQGLLAPPSASDNETGVASSDAFASTLDLSSTNARELALAAGPVIDPNGETERLSSVPQTDKTSAAPSGKPKIAGYVALAKLQEDAVRTVWRARHSSTQREVSLTILHEQTLDEEVHAALTRDLTLTARIDAPHIARLDEFHLKRSPWYTIASSVEGPTLEVAAAKRPLRERLDLIYRLCRALEPVHAKGLVHRALSPQTIRVTSKSDVQIFDVGLGALFDAHRQQSLTKVGLPARDVAYAAPEQLRRDGDVDGRADVFPSASFFTSSSRDPTLMDMLRMRA